LHDWFTVVALVCGAQDGPTGSPSFPHSHLCRRGLSHRRVLCRSSHLLLPCVSHAQLARFGRSCGLLFLGDIFFSPRFCPARTRAPWLPPNWSRMPPLSLRSWWLIVLCAPEIPVPVPVGGPIGSPPAAPPGVALLGISCASPTSARAACVLSARFSSLCYASSRLLFGLSLVLPPLYAPRSSFLAPPPHLAPIRFLLLSGLLCPFFPSPGVASGPRLSFGLPPPPPLDSLPLRLWPLLFSFLPLFLAISFLVCRRPLVSPVWLS